MSSNSLFETEEDFAQANKLSRKMKESPFMLVGIAGFVAAGLVGAYKYRNRGSMSTSVFLMQLRVAAQGTVVGCLTAGLAYTMAKEYLLHEDPKDDTKKADEEHKTTPLGRKQKIMIWLDSQR
ncbi:HIG1 domain family member 1A, mitochondrial-like [Drosophila ficusphila]|uniref:HIG1 domain family member 1A, mitochondrial-like n=1 Tax=Drosophila ficusphila TaxID=30025 RepID=UPI0007E7DC95|nr:HIG1 domain family member 1A, mitochondrial-like [Drosophila ficusphila]